MKKPIKRSLLSMSISMLFFGDSATAQQQIETITVTGTAYWKLIPNLPIVRDEAAIRKLKWYVRFDGK